MAKKKTNVAGLKKLEAKLEKSPKKTPFETAIEKKISQATGKPYIGKR